jgi:hypothetical protein
VTAAERSGGIEPEEPRTYLTFGGIAGKLHMLSCSARYVCKRDATLSDPPPTMDSGGLAPDDTCPAQM